MNYNDFFVVDNLPEPLSQSELYSYFEKMRSGDTKAREIIIKHNIKLVIYRVQSRFYNTPYEKKELVSIGLTGLIKSVDNFNISKKSQFSTFSTRCIDNEILCFLAKEKKHRNVESLNSLLTADKDGNELSLADTLSDERSDLVSDYINKEESIIIKHLIEKLPERDKRIITLYFGFINKPLTQDELADKLGISQPSVSRLISKILTHIKEQLKKCGIVESSSDEITKKESPAKKTSKIKGNEETIKQLLQIKQQTTPTEEIRQEQPNNVDGNNTCAKEDPVKVLELLKTQHFKQLI